MNRSLKLYARHLREKHLDALVLKNLEISKTLEIPFMRHYQHLSDEQLLNMAKPAMEELLLSIEDDSVWEKAQATYKKWKDDKLNDVTKYDIHPNDIVMINSVRKKGFLSFITSYTYEVDEISELISQMDDFFRESDRTAMEVIYEIQKGTEKKYRESEERYRDLFENANDLIYITDLSGLLIFANKAWLKYTGYSSSDISDLSILKLIHPDSMQVFTTENKRVIEGGSPREFSFALLNSEGKKVYLEGSISCQFINDKAVTTRGIFTNITSKKLNEEKLKIYTHNLIESEERYRLLVENVKDYAIFFISPEGMVLTWNKGAEQIIGFTAKEIIGSSLSVFYPPEIEQKIDVETSLSIARENGMYQSENIWIRKNGFRFWANILLTPLFEKSGKLKGYVNITRNITERKQAEENLRASENKLQAIFDHAADAIIVSDLNHKVTAWNYAAERIYGYSEAEAIGKNSFELLKASFKRPYTLNSSIEEMNLSGSWTGELASFNKQGEKITILCSLTTLYNKDSKPYGILAVNKDITERKKADEKINKTIQLLNEAEKVAHFGSWEINTRTNEITWSNELYRIFGIEPKESHSLWKVFFKSIFPEDRDLVVKAVEKAMRDKETIAVEFRITNAKNELRWLIANCSVYSNTDENEVKLTGTVQDITERKANDDKIAKTLQQLSEAQRLANIGSWEWDIASDSITFSEELRKIYAQGEGEKVLNYKAFLNFIHDDDREELNSKITKALNDHAPFKVDHRIVRKNGSIKILSTHGIVTIGSNKKVIKISGTGQDITERVLTKEELKKAENTVKAKQQFLSNMSHEIRTPLNSILGFTKIILKSNLSERQREYIDAINLSGQTLLVLINDILDLAKVDAGKLVFEKIPFRLSSSVTAMLHLFEARLKEQNIELINEFDSRIPDALIGDPVRFNQILLNLVGNAIKFTHRGKVVMKSALLGINNHMAHLEFSITDTGIGIAEEHLESIFENFQQASNSTGRLYGGTGLGLAIVKQLVTNQGGSIHVKSELNKGTTFSFNLSFEIAKNHDLKEVEEEIYKSAVFQRGVKILVAEDVELNQLLMKAILDDFNCEYAIAKNGLEAINKLKTDSFDLILMDLQMPEMNGFEAAEHIRKNLFSEIPIIALTADITTVDLERCLEVGMNDFVTKPIDEKLLYHKINKWLKQPSLGDSLQNSVGKSKNGYQSKKKITNLDYLSKKVKGNTTLLREMLKIYLEQTPQLVKIMMDSFENKNYENLQKAAHKLIPSFAMVGIDPSYEEYTKQIQGASLSGEKPAQIHALLIKIQHICFEACRELEMEYAEMNP